MTKKRLEVGLKRRNLSPVLIEKILKFEFLTLSDIEKSTIDDLKKKFDEVETLEIWEKIVIKKRISKTKDENYQELKKFLCKDGKSLEQKKELKTALNLAISKINNLFEGKKKIVLFLGNGMSEVRHYNPETGKEEILDKSLSSEFLVKNFIHDISEEDPREFQMKKDTIKEINDLFHKSGSTLDLLKFMTHFSKIEMLKEDFLNHVIRTCCKASPNSNYLQLFLFCLINKSLNPNLTIVIFTTNYDNLIEKVYLEFREELRNYSGYYRHLRYTPDVLYEHQKDGSIIKVKKISRQELSSSYPPIIQQLRPKYLMSENPMAFKRSLPIIPIHGSIRVCKCSNCGRQLSSEAAAVGLKCCVYCGSELSSIVLPTTEGKADKELLKMLGKEVEQSDLLIFIGYGFDDPHISQRISDSLGEKLKTIINICNIKLDQKKISVDKHEVIDICDYIDSALLNLNGEIIPTTSDDEYLSALYNHIIRRRFIGINKGSQHLFN